MKLIALLGAMMLALVSPAFAGGKPIEGSEFVPGSPLSTAILVYGLIAALTVPLILRKRIFALFGAILLFIVPAHAAEVSIPWGEWLAGSLSYFRDAIVGGVALAVTWGARKLPGQIGEMILAMRLEQLLKRAVDYGIASVEGAAKDKVFTVNVTNQVIAEAVTYAAKSAPTLAGKFADSLRAKILARLAAEGVVPAEASKSNVNAAV